MTPRRMAIHFCLGLIACDGGAAIDRAESEHFSGKSDVAGPRPIVPDPDTLQRKVAENIALAQQGIDLARLATGVERPVADFETIRYLFFTEGPYYDSQRVKETIAANLPADVILVVLAQPGDESSVRATYSRFLPKERLKILSLAEADGAFWARDALPVPVYTGADAKAIALVDARYYHHFESDAHIARFFDAKLLQHSYWYEGGNFEPDAAGNCYLVNAGTGARLPDAILESRYGCKQIRRLAYRAGIGHVDEVLRLVSNKIAVTNEPAYVGELEQAGFRVVQLPKAGRRLETYANSLIVNGTVFLPIFNEPTDAEAIKLYKQLGLRVIPIETQILSNDGKGSIHCITMGYPDSTAVRDWILRMEAP